MKSTRLLAIVALAAVLSTIALPIFAFSNPVEAKEVETVEVLETEAEVIVPEIIVIDTTEGPKPTISETPVVTRVAKCYVNLHKTPNVADTTDMVTVARGVKLEGSFSNDWFKTKYNNQEYYVYSEFLVTEEEWEKLSKIPYSSEVPLSEDLQEYLWNECQDLGIKYTFALAVIDLETGGTFRADLISKTNDWGIMQVNKCWHKTFKKMGYITCSEDLLNPYNGIHCGLWILNQYTSQFGSVERSYAAYNTGNTNIKSNKNSREVMRRFEKWQSILGDI